MFFGAASMRFADTHDRPTTMPAMPLHRSRQHRVLAGVCGGIADWLGWSPTLVRILFVLVSVLSAAFPGIIVYIVLWILMPNAAKL
jgi:phage shock protein PspC (stress-responsive transcriptional regulator)